MPKRAARPTQREVWIRADLYSSFVVVIVVGVVGVVVVDDDDVESAVGMLPMLPLLLSSSGVLPSSFSKRSTVDVVDDEDTNESAVDEDTNEGVIALCRIM